MCFHAFGQCFRLFLDRALQKLENLPRAISKLLMTENRIKKLLLVRFLLPFFFCQMVENYAFYILFGPHYIISAYTQDYELKFSIKTNFDTVISNLKLHFQYNIIMTS